MNVFHFFDKFWQSLKEWYVVKQYVKYGLRIGEMDSYWYMGEAVGYQSDLKRLEKWKICYTQLGYKPLTDEEWLLAGGYDAPYKHLLLIKEQNAIGT